MKILVVFTGGTIGSSVENGYICTDDQKKYQLINMYQEKYEKESVEIEFCYTELYSILSENLTGKNIYILQKYIAEKISEKKYDGIIITHGTDTLVYMAAAVGYAVGNDCIPVMFVSSNYVLDDQRANGLKNFCMAVDFIKNKYGKGVFVVYKNSNEKIYIHRATRTLMQLPCDDNVYSVCNSYYGEYINNQYYENDLYKEFDDESDTLTLQSDNECSDVARVVQLPGQQYFLDYRKVKAVILDSYHSGTVCFENKSFTNMLRNCMDKGIKVFLSGANLETDYESVKEFEKYNIITLPVSSPVAMYIKIWIFCNDKENIEAKVCKSLAGDIFAKKL